MLIHCLIWTVGSLMLVFVFLFVFMLSLLSLKSLFIYISFVRPTVYFVSSLFW